MIENSLSMLFALVDAPKSICRFQIFCSALFGSKFYFKFLFLIFISLRITERNFNKRPTSSLREMIIFILAAVLFFRIAFNRTKPDALNKSLSLECTLF